MSELKKVLIDYYEKFGMTYPISIGLEEDTEDIIRNAKQCIADGKPKEPLQYKDGFVY